MFGKKKNQNVYQGPYRITGSLARLIGEEWGKITQSGDHWVEYLAVSRPHQENQAVIDVRVFDKWCAVQKKVEVKDFSSLDGHPELIVMEGWYDEKAKKASIKAKAA
jgi:hypothetical protein